jgi:hypothetical protein
MSDVLIRLWDFFQRQHVCIDQKCHYTQIRVQWSHRVRRGTNVLIWRHNVCIYVLNAMRSFNCNDLKNYYICWAYSAHRFLHIHITTTWLFHRLCDKLRSNFKIQMIIAVIRRDTLGCSNPLGRDVLGASNPLGTPRKECPRSWEGCSNPLEGDVPTT